MALIRDRNIDVLFDAETLAARNDALAIDIAKNGHDNLLVIAVLKGSFIFAADLVRSMHKAGMSPEIEFITLSSYGADTTSSGTVRVVRDIETDVAGRNVLLIDDILESGRTISFAKNLMLERGAASAEIAILLDKTGKRVADITAEYVGFECPDYFVVGYGMDVAHAFRELPFVGVVAED
ncbi:MAG: hypoxanthine phosphoribosyltransferase [Alphaproteobacteria bacterium]|uniref:hypoxanthine phosphoribosyltransferase n=1 Tax=Pararhizobium sp. IMCC21322 TaxID=3067903 RepID=UPI002742577B|nr:hypoxanthine phosphoribosyltransferase [Pararhizobium sp. IMCC21322]MCR9237005.1 hypoxanthine phosphoribosyltransferase [Alphaproteobacteria bacterium]